MMSIMFITPQAMQQKLAQRARDVRLELNLSQQTLSAKSGVSYGSLKKFEQSGQISLESLLKLALVLGCMDDFTKLFLPLGTRKTLSLDEMIAQKTRKRGRK
jgi:transcriptional regulator with XRE-family HTH domain